MSATRPRCRVCRWHPTHRSQRAARRAALAHSCHPTRLGKEALR
ncbi:hypothetical protein ACGFRG_08710 [Streptomyces sp. NPDC048696]